MAFVVNASGNKTIDAGADKGCAPGKGAAARGPIVTVRVPASTANLGPGFDAVGLALDRYVTVTLAEAARTSVIPRGSVLAGTPASEENLVYRAVRCVFDRLGCAVPPLRLEVESDIPLARGLGSSAAAIVGGLVAANAYLGEPLTREELLAMAAEMEGHPDNVGAALFGGVVVAVRQEDGRVPYLRLPVPEDLVVVAAVPDVPLETAKARRVLPEAVTRRDAAYALGQTGLLVAAIATGQWDRLADAMRDRLHQPYRLPLIPGAERMVREAPEHGALGAALSGAGPTVVAFTFDGAERVAAFFRRVMAESGLPGTVCTFRPDTQGARVWRNEKAGER